MFTRRSNIVASGPQFAPPVCSTQAGKLGIQLTRRNALDHIHHLRRRIAWWATDEQVHMVCLHGQGFYFPIPRHAYLTDQLLQPQSYITSQHLAAVARNPNEVMCQSVNRMCAPSCFHDGDYSIARSCGPLCRLHFAGRANQRTALPVCGGPAFLPAASDGVSGRRIS